MLRRYSLLILIIISYLAGYSQKIVVNDQFAKVNYYLGLKDSIDDAKWEGIKILTDSLSVLKKNNKLERQYEISRKISKEYEYFVYDSAFHYGNKTLRFAYQLEDESRIAEAKSDLALVLLLKGLYKEAIDTIQTVNPKALSLDERVEFYATAYRAYYDLSNSRWGYYAPIYRQLGDGYVKKIQEEGKANSYNYQLALALKGLNNQDNISAIKHYSFLTDNLNLDPHQAAICHCGLGIALNRVGKNSEAKENFKQAVIGDILSATKETLAARMLAESLFYDGDLEKANKFISEARKDAEFYGSNVRRLEISFIQPKIKAAVLDEVEKEKELVFKVSIIILILLLIIIVFTVIFFKQLQELKKARNEILDRNENLRIVNENLREVSRIKEEYVGYYFNFSSQFIEKMDSMKKAISRQLMTKQYDAINTELRKYNPKRERQDLFEDFDRIFLKLFPDFIKRFNQLFNDDNQAHLKDSQSLNTDLRIFALIRLGISDNEKIASILNFSVNTIYTYKTRIKNRSLVSNDEFEDKIMEIKSV